MRIFTITHADQGRFNDDQCHGVEGEIALALGPPKCDDPDCRCWDTFIGLGSRGRSTTAMIATTDLSWDAILLAHLDFVEALVGDVDEATFVGAAVYAVQMANANVNLAAKAKTGQLARHYGPEFYLGPVTARPVGRVPHI